MADKFREAFDNATFDALVFDWDGTAVPDRQANAAGVRGRIQRLCAMGVDVFIISGTHVGNVDGQLRARPSGPGRLHMCLNRGSEVFEVGRDGPQVVWRRTATAIEERSLDGAAELTVTRLAERGVSSQVVSQRLNRRKIDIIPEPAWAEPPKARIGELLAAVSERLRQAGVGDLTEVVAIATDAAREAGLADPRITSDVKHVEIGVTDKTDSARWAAAWLARRGITGRLILVGGDEFGAIGGVVGSDSFMLVSELARAAVVSVGVEPGGVPAGVTHVGGGPDRFIALLDAQIKRRTDRRAPSVDVDPAWTLPLPDATLLERVAEALGALSNGWAGTRVAQAGAGTATAPLFVVNGVYSDASPPGLLHGPVWSGVELRGEDPPRHGDRRWVDLRTGVLASDGDADSPRRSVRFASGVRPHVLALRVEADTARLIPADALAAPKDAVGFERAARDDVQLARTGNRVSGGIAMAARECVEANVDGCVVDRLVGWASTAAGVASWDEAADPLVEAEALGFDRLLSEHREAWAQKWADAEVTIEGDAQAQLAARFAVFHLLCVAPDEGEAAVGARGLTGDAYSGHVFWDADVFVLPALAAVRPAAARAMLEYRIRRLPAARAAAAALGRAGTRFPWESAGTGFDVTPRSAINPQGETVAILTGQQEEHVVADVAWAAHHYADWTGDRAFLAGPGRDLIVETARYWASRIRIDTKGAGHIDGVIGPDEYHESVDDNAFTNVMARWNLRRGAGLLATAGRKADADAKRWRALADALVDGWDARRGLYEQFDGYWDLESLLIADFATPPVAADMLLGAPRVNGSQLIKQADVLMLHHLVPDEVERGSLRANLAFYEPRCAHGSSLSAAIHASLLARARQPERALELFRLAAQLDLDDVTGSTAGGLHLATMGGVWQALAYGFLGLRAHAEFLEIDPCLPAAWSAVGLRFRFRGVRVGVRAEHDAVTVSCDNALLVRVGSAKPVHCDPPGHTFELKETTS